MRYVNKILTKIVNGAYAGYRSFMEARWYYKLITVLVAIVVALLIIGGVQYARDYSAGYNMHWDCAIVTSKQYTPPRSEVYTTYNSSTKSSQTHTRYIPADYDVFCRGERDSYGFDVNKRFFAAIAEGDSVYVIARIGGYSGKCLRKWITTDLSTEDLTDGTVENFRR